MITINGLQYDFMNKKELKELIIKEQIFDNPYKIQFQKLSDREQRLLNKFIEFLESGNYDFNTFKTLFMPIYDNAFYRQKRDLSINIREENGKIIVYLNSEYAGTGNGYYYLLDIQNRKKILLDID